MIFEETEDGMLIDVPHKEMMCMDTEQFITLIMMARRMYQRHNYAEMDDDHSDRK